MLVQEVNQGCVAIREAKDHRVWQESLVQLDQLARKDPMAALAPQEKWENGVKQDRRAQVDKVGRSAPWDHQDQEENLVLKAHRVPPGH
jgi:hypothetical protein